MEVIQLPKSVSNEMFLEIQKIKIIKGDTCGHKKDIKEY
jgi:hypothetical protein